MRTNISHLDLTIMLKDALSSLTVSAEHIIWSIPLMVQNSTDKNTYVLRTKLELIRKSKGDPEYEGHGSIKENIKKSLIGWSYY